MIVKEELVIILNQKIIEVTGGTKGIKDFNWIDFVVNINVY